MLEQGFVIQAAIKITIKSASSSSYDSMATGIRDGFSLLELNFSWPISANLISHVSFTCVQAGFDCGPVVGVMTTLLSVAFQEVGYKYVRM